MNQLILSCPPKLLIIWRHETKLLIVIGTSFSGSFSIVSNQLYAAVIGNNLI